VPQMQRRATLRETIPQILLVAVGVLVVLFLTSKGHHH
jgi:zinc and cadmium transporter